MIVDTNTITFSGVCQVIQVFKFQVTNKDCRRVVTWESTRQLASVTCFVLVARMSPIETPSFSTQK